MNEYIKKSDRHQTTGECSFSDEPPASADAFSWFPNSVWEPPPSKLRIEFGSPARETEFPGVGAQTEFGHQDNRGAVIQPCFPSGSLDGPPPFASLIV